MQEYVKRASWLELFYDLAYIALIAQFTYLLAEHHTTVRDFLNVFIVGYSIFIAWWATTANRNLQASLTQYDKVLIQLQMAGAFLMSITMPAVFAGHYEGYFVTLAVVRFLQVAMLLRMYRLHPDSAPATNNIVQGLAIAGVLWALSGYIPDPYHFVVALMALGLDIMTPRTTGKNNRVRLLNVEHLQERLGLFLMFVIGESMIVVALANTATSLTLIEPLLVLSGLATMVALWWLYFEHLEYYHGQRPRDLFLFLHAHGFLFGSIIVLSVGYKFLLSSAAPFLTLLFVGSGLVGMILTLTVIRLSYHKRSKATFFLGALIGGLFVIITAIGYRLEAYYEATALLIVLLFAVTVFDYRYARSVRTLSRETRH